MPSTKSDQQREELREELFGEEAWLRAWRGPEEKGFACVPRVLPILLQLAHDSGITGNKDCRSAYLELFTQNWGQALIEIKDEHAHALRSGYLSSRAVRTWNERIATLEREGFIETHRRSVRRVGYVLLIHPHKVITKLRKEKKVSDTIWAAFCEACREFGIAKPDDPLEA